MEILLLRNWKRNLVDCQWISLMNMNASENPTLEEINQYVSEVRNGKK